MQKHFHEHGTPSKRNRSGRPRLLGPYELSELEKFITTDKTTRRMSYKEIAERCNLNCGEHTIQRACKELGFRMYIPRRKELLSPWQKAFRYAWAQDVVKWGYDEWSRILFTDEASFSTDHKAYNVRVLRRSGEEYHPDCVDEGKHQGRNSVMVWGAICDTTKSELHVVQGRVSLYFLLQLL